MFGMSIWEILIVLGLLFIVVGPGKLPGLAKTIGDQIRGLRENLADVKATVDKDDEFIKAVTEARQSVAEAKDAVRGIIDDMVSVTDDLGLDDAMRDPAPKPVSRGRKRVSLAGEKEDDSPTPESEPESENSPDSDPGPGPALADDPVEAEDWRASTRGNEVAEADDGEPGDSAQLGDQRAVPSEPVRRGSTGRRMIKPGKSGRTRTGDGE